MVMLVRIKLTDSAMVNATAAGPGLPLKTGQALMPTAAATQRQNQPRSPTSMVMPVVQKPMASAMVSATAAGPGLQLKTGQALMPTAAAARHQMAIARFKLKKMVSLRLFTWLCMI